MDQAALARLIAGPRRFWKAGGDRVHYGIAFAAAQRMTRHRGWLVDHQHGGVLEKPFEWTLGIRNDFDLQRLGLGRGLNFNPVARSDQRAFGTAPAVDAHQPLLDQRLRHAARRSISEAHEMDIEALAGS